MIAWDLLLQHSTLPDNSIAWDHLQSSCGEITPIFELVAEATTGTLTIEMATLDLVLTPSQGSMDLTGSNSTLTMETTNGNLQQIHCG